MRYVWNSKLFRFMLLIPCAYYGFKTYKTFYPSEFPLQPKGPSGGFYLLGKHYPSPQQTFIEKVRKYMGGVIKEVLADEKVNTEGLNFLDRLFRH